MLARAFADDPAFKYIFPNAADRAKRLPRLFSLMIEDDAGAGLQLVTPGIEAATLWRGPGHAATGTFALLRQAIPLLHALGFATARALRVANAIEAHFPGQPFWYLHIAGCAPEKQGRGFGGAVIRAGLERAAGRLPAYLETATESNLGLYQRFGFAVTDEWRVGTDGPRFWSMLRAKDDGG
ncbi:GNAT family N-acetyltransferase [Sphingomonadaceae bacterium LXI357]|uniref:GNAT family N-acetyltransferase n=2 Tax=Stakelama marina TaxID=2826939 RepID=A0A8T4IFX1_9SPHN|nr:GNAT family N-acetyltransferase [Stakelama marina]